ncbi:MAG: DNA-binding protein [Clostridia bacterium]|nr:DNA-binding protein [Clostridia bacterium]
MSDIKLVRMYNSEEASKLIGLSVRTVKQYARTGRIQAQKIGNSWMISEEAIKRFLKGERKPEATDALAAFIPGLATELRDLRQELILTQAAPVTIKLLDGILKSYIGPMELITRANV